MKMSQLKTLMIIILVIVNVFLMIQVIMKKTDERVQKQEVKQSLVDLLKKNDIEISPGIIPEEQTLEGLDAVRAQEAESRAAQALLGKTEPVDMGGGINSYESLNGRAEFRMGGDFIIELESETKYRAADSAKKLFKDIGFSAQKESVQQRSENGQSYVTAMQEIDGVPLFDCTVTAVFGPQGLQSISGNWVTGTQPNSQADTAMSAPTALVTFLDWSGIQGKVCGEILELRAGYQLIRSGTAATLAPVWRIVADTGVYYLDALTGDIHANT